MATDDNAVSDIKDGNAEAEGQSKSGVEAKNQGKPMPSPKSKPAASTEAKSDDPADSAASAEESLVNELKAKLEQAEKNAAENHDEVLRARAELENTRKRLQREIENAHKYAVEKFVQALLPVIDSLEMGVAAASQKDADIKAVKEGTELTLKMFADCADKFGMQAVDPKGEKFDPEFHQAMSIQESDEHEPDTVIAVMQKGYLLNGRLIRPAMVVVAKAGSESAKSGDQKPSESENPEKSS